MVTDAAVRQDIGKIYFLVVKSSAEIKVEACWGGCFRGCRKGGWFG